MVAATRGTAGSRQTRLAEPRDDGAQAVRQEAPSGRGWAARPAGPDAVIALSGDWIGHRTGVEAGAAQRILAACSGSIAFDCGGLGHWDSGLIAFLSALRDIARDRNVRLELNGLPAPARGLLALVAAPAAASTEPPRPPLAARVGRWTLGVLAETIEILGLVGSLCLRSGAALRGRARMRGIDLIDCMRDAGAGALPIVALVNFLVGGILAFVGAVQLRRFGADAYVASLVGIAVVREMAALMTAIIMAGRTGGAYAANIATMEGNEEIDALRTVGIPVFDYLILPRVVSLSGMMPILYLYACAFGILGGFVVATAMLDVSPMAYIDETRKAISGSQFGLGLAKSLSFGTLIAVVGCRIGLQAGRSAADVGRAATTAVVTGIVGIILLDAVFAICANALDI